MEPGRGKNSGHALVCSLLTPDRKSGHSFACRSSWRYGSDTHPIVVPVGVNVWSVLKSCECPSLRFPHLLLKRSPSIHHTSTRTAVCFFCCSVARLLRSCSGRT